MALLADDELDALRVQMDHTAAVAAKPTYPLTPTTTPKEPTWVDSASGGYYDDGLGHYSNNAGATWDYTPPATTPTTWNLPPELASLPQDTLPTTPQPFIPSYDLPAEPQFSPWDSTPGSMVGFGETFRPDWGVMTTPGAEVPAHLRGSFADPNIDGPDLSFGEQIKGGLGSAGSALNTLASGNKFVRELTGGHVDPSTLPYNLDKLSDVALSPVTWATAGAGQGFRGAGVLGSVVKGPFAKRLAGEVAVGTGGLVGSEKAAEQAAEYTDNPYLIGGAGVLGGLAGAGGVIGAVGAAKRVPGAVKAADRALTTTDIGSKLGGETGALDMGAVADVASAARRSPVGRAVAKVTPGGMEVTPGALDTGTRVGDILHAPILDETATPKQVLVVDRNLTRRVASASNQIDAEAAPAWRALGKTFTDDNGNVYLKDVAPSPAEIERGLPGALAVRVIEKPGEYTLTPAQAKAVTKLGELTDRVANERDLLGAPVNRLAGEEGDIYQHRKALKPSEATQAEQLVAEKDPRANELYKGGGGGSRLAIGKDKSRIYADPADAVRDGVVYADPRAAFNENVSASLTKAKNAHIKTLLEPFGQTSADRISPEFRAAVDDARSTVAKLEGRLGTAETRTARNQALATELNKPLDRLNAGVKTRAEARATLSDAKKELTLARREADADARALQRQVVGDAKAVGRAGVRDQQATARLTGLLKRADALGEKIRDLEAKLGGVKDKEETLARWGSLTGDKEVRASIIAARKEARNLAKQIDAEYRAGFSKRALPVESAAVAAEGATGARGAATGALSDTTEAGQRFGAFTKGAEANARASVESAAKDLAPEEVYRTMNQMERRIQTLLTRGDIRASEARALRADLDVAKQRLDDMLPKWKLEQQRAAAVPGGRRSIPHDMAPALIGTDFDKETAARIISQYGGGIRVGNKVMETKLPGVKALNALLHPINATLDFSVTLNQLAILGVSNKREFAANLLRSMRDMVDDTNYNKWLADPKTADSARWVTIYGHTGDQGDFLARGLEKIPGIAQTQKQFARFGNRMRVAALDSIADSAAKSAGRELDDTAMEQIGRAVDRLSGVSMSRATDAESIAQFAPNFFRSIIETTAHAVSDGGLEGQIARQYLKNYAALGAGLVTATAIAQNRDLGEVLNPFDKRAWERGQIKINPNWMTIRVGDQDINVFGAYDSAIKLLVAGADAGFRSVKEQDANQLFDALGYAAGSKGSAPVKFITDLIKGETWGGGDPMNKWELGKRALPISAQQAVQSWQEGESVKDIAINTGLSMLGAKANPVTDYEKKDKQAMDAYGKPWDQLSPVEQNALRAVPGSPAANYQSTNPDAVASQERRARDTAARVEKQTQIDQRYIPSGATAPANYDDGKAWRDERNTLRFAANELYKKDQRDFPYTGPESKHPMRLAMDEWGSVIDANTKGTKTDWDRVDAWEAANPDKAKLVDEYLSDPNRPKTDETPVVTANKAASKSLGDAGFFDLRDNLWAELNAQSPAPGYVAGQGYYDWRAAMIEQTTQEMIASGVSPTIAATKAETAVDTKHPVVKKFNEVYKSKALYPWVDANPDLANTAVVWGYLYPDTKIQKFFQSRESK